METLKNVSLIVCEDTRVTGHLLTLLELPKRKLIPMHSYSDEHTMEGIMQALHKGMHVALVSDAGTPGISDPGYALVSRARKEGIQIEVIPGAAAFLAALSVSGLPMNQFSYLGFLPIKKGRKTLLSTFPEEEKTIVFYESVHRIEKTLMEMVEILKDQPERQVAIARELTKLHEEVKTGTVADLPEIAKTITKKGEFVVMIGPL